MVPPYKVVLVGHAFHGAIETDVTVQVGHGVYRMGGHANRPGLQFCEKNVEIHVEFVALIE